MKAFTIVYFLLAMLQQQVKAFAPPSIHVKSYGGVSSLSTIHKVQGLVQTTRRTTTQLAGTVAPGLESSMYLVRIVFLRALAFIYGVAFMVAYNQNKALIGDDGLTPARQVLRQARIRGKMKRKYRDEWIARGGLDGTSRNNPLVNLWFVKTFRRMMNRNKQIKYLRERLWDRQDSANRPVTTLLWLAKSKAKLDPWLDNIALAGITMSALVCILGAANLPLLLGMWLCQRSLMAVGGVWYAYGWEPQLAELGFHALFLVPLLSVNPFAAPPVPAVVAWSIRWYLFRIMMGAGLIKMKGGREWKDLTAMNYHYETQPVPNPLSKFFHFAPNKWHQWEVLTNHFVELVAPFLLLIPLRPFRLVGGMVQLIFQGVLILSGNLSFLNWLTAVPALLCLDDAFVSRLFSANSVALASAAHAIDTYNTPMSSTARRLVTVLFGLLIGRLSIPVVRNLCSKNQIMNGSFDSLRLVNTYGAFGTVNFERNELVISSAVDYLGEWKEYEFPVKPGDPFRRPRWISPYHYRLDWQLWIASQFGSIGRSRWMYTFLTKLLENDPQVMQSLVAHNPWEGETEQPKYIRIEEYRYKYHQGGKSPSSSSDEHQRRPFWDREYIRRWYPTQGVTTLETLKGELEYYS